MTTVDDVRKRFERTITKLKQALQHCQTKSSSDPVVPEVLKRAVKMAEERFEDVEVAKKAFIDFLEKQEAMEPSIRESIEDKYDNLAEEHQIILDKIQEQLASLQMTTQMKQLEAHVPVHPVTESQQKITVTHTVTTPAESPQYLEAPNATNKIGVNQANNKPQWKGPSIKLRPYDPDPWDGKFKTFPTFKREFTAAMEAGGVKKDAVILKWLRSLLPEDKKSMIAGRTHVTDTWKALGLLVTDKRVYEELTKEFRSLRLQNSDYPEELQDFIAKVYTLIEHFKDLGIEDKHKERDFVYDLLRKAGPNHSRQIENELALRSEHGQDNCELSTEFILEYLQRQIRHWSGHKLAKNTGRSDRNNPKPSTAKVNSVNTVKLTEANGCKSGCSESHALAECPVFLRKEHNGRSKYCKEKGFCFKCLNSGHIKPGCTSSINCSKCKGEHHDLLHRENNAYQFSPNPSAPVFKPRQEHTGQPPVVLHANTVKAAQNARLPVVKVKVQVRPREGDVTCRYVEARALIDGGSDTTLVGREFARRHGLQGIGEAQILVEVVGGKKHVEQTEIFDLTVQGWKGDEFKISAYAISKPCGLSGPLPNSTFEEFPYLKRIKSCVDLEGGPMDILIGRDYQPLQEEIGQLKPDRRVRTGEEPVAIEYLLGWTVVGRTEKKHRPDNSSTKRVNRVSVVETSTPMRVVWNSAKEYKGESVANALEKGPDRLNSLFSILLGFREEKVAITGDIRKMFNNIAIDEKDRRYHRFLWIQCEDEEPTAYEWQRLVFGDPPSPDLSQEALRFLAKLSQEEYPNGCEALMHRTYMDDVADSHREKIQAQLVGEESSKILAKGSFAFKEWNSNNEALEQELNNMIDCKKEIPSVTDILGHKWKKKEDLLLLKNGFIPEVSVMTKRTILGAIAKVWDPLGIASPCMIKLRMEFQDLWKRNISWDQVFDEKLESDWRGSFEEVCPNLLVEVKRCMRPEEDGGAKGYGTVAYFRWKLFNETVKVRFISAKALVTPVKGWTVPRTELVAALVMARVRANIVKALRQPPDKTFFWSDSMTVLHWIRDETQKLKTFVEARIGEILDLASSDEFHYVPSNQNLADVLTKDKEDVDLAAWHEAEGSFLYQNPLPCFETTAIVEAISCEQNLSEIRQKKKRKKKGRPRGPPLHTLVKSNVALVKSLEEKPMRPEESSKIIEMVLKEDSWMQGLHAVQKTNNSEEAKLQIFQALQAAINFRENRFQELCPLYDQDNRIYRVGGRLQAAKKLDIRVVAPVILWSSKREEDEKRLKVLTLLAQHYHKKGHNSIERVQSLIERDGIWIVRARRLLKQVRKKCLFCRKRYNRLGEQLMGQLPDFRTDVGCEPFRTTALYFFGPLKVRLRRGVEKPGHVALFTCTTTRAVHLELC